MTSVREPAVWFPAVRAGTGTDVFTERLAAGLTRRGIRAEITWLPLRAEYAPWTVPVPKPPSWANVVHVNTWLHPRFIPNDLPVVATVHHAMHHPNVREHKGFARAAYHRLWIAPNERRVLQCANRVVAVSRFVANAAHETLVDVPMQVIYNGIDTERFQPPHQRVPHQPFRLLYVGGWKKMKGVDLLGPIMRELGAGFELHYTGGDAANKYKSGMPSNMHDIGRLKGDEAVIAAMQSADALLFPSRSEGFGLVAAEAMACGLPLIAAQGSSLEEIVESGVTGWLCKRDDVPAFVAACRRLCMETAGRTRMQMAAQARVLAEFSLDAMTRAYLAVYVSIERKDGAVG